MWVLLSWSSEIFDFELKHRSDALILHGSSAIFYLKHRSDALILHGSIPKSYDCMCYVPVNLRNYFDNFIACGYNVSLVLVLLVQLIYLFIAVLLLYNYSSWLYILAKEQKKHQFLRFYELLYKTHNTLVFDASYTQFINL